MPLGVDSAPERVITTRERIAYSVFNGADLLIKNLIGKYLFFFYTTTLGVNPMWIAIGQPLVKILDVATDPLVGEWSDRTRSKMGRRRPWILWGSIALGIVFPMTWMPQFVMFWDAAPTVVSIFVYFLVFKFLYYISHTVAVVPYYALGAELSTDYQERTRIVAWRHMIGVPVIILATLPYMLATNPDLFPDEQTGIAVVMLVVGIIIISTGMVTALGTKEHVRSQRNPPMPIMQAVKITLSNRPFIFLVLTVLIYGIGQYFSVSFAAYLITYVIYDGDKEAFATLLFQATVLGVITSMGLNLLVRRLGQYIEKARLMKICMGLSLMVPVAVLFSFDPEHPYLYFVFHALALPIGNTMIEILPLSIVADVCDIDEVKSGRRREGAFVGVYNAGFKSGYLLAPSLTMFLLAMTGFQGLAPEQTAETQELLKFYMMAGTGVPFALAFLLSLGIGLRRSEVDEAQAQLTEEGLTA